MSTQVTRLLVRDGPLSSKAGNNIGASRHNEQMQVLLAVMNGKSLSMKFGFLERVRPGRIFPGTIAVLHNADNLSKQH